MRIVRALAAWGLVVGIGCQPSAPTAPTPDPSVAPEAEVKKAPPPQTAALSPAQLDAMALRCDGAALLALGSSVLAGVEAGPEHPSARLLASWEAGRRFDGDTIDTKAVDAWVETLHAHLGTAPPRWWVDTLKSGRGGEGVATRFSLELGEGSDRRGPIAPGPGDVLVRPGHPLVESSGSIAYDLSMGRVSLAPIPETKGTALEVTRARAGSTLYVATFEPGAGGFRFPLRAVGSDGSERWKAEVCAADRKALGGRGYQIVELKVLETSTAKPGTMAPSEVRGLAVFTAESHGVTVETFDVNSGERTFAWSSDLWSWRE